MTLGTIYVPINFISSIDICSCYMHKLFLINCYRIIALFLKIFDRSIIFRPHSTKTIYNPYPQEQIRTVN